MRFRNWLKGNIDKKGLQEEDICLELDVCIDIVERMLKGEIVPSKRKTARKLSKLFDLDLEHVHSFMLECKKGKKELR